MSKDVKRILIYSHALELGGAERALIGLLHALDYDRVEVDLFLLHHTGAFMADIPPQVNLLPEKPQYASMAVPFKTVLKKRQLGVALGRLIGKKAAAHRERSMELTCESIINLEYSHKYTRFFMPPMGEGEYDLAVSFLIPHYYVAEKVRAKKKIAWIHTDYSKLIVDRESELKMWSRFDHIASISDNVTETFLEVFPSLKDRVVLIENVLPEQVIRKQTKEFDVSGEMPRTRPRLLSIGRFCHQKNFDNVPDICRRLVQMGLDVAWYLVGFGDGEALIRSKIAEAGMEDHVILLGQRENPYPYIQTCDVYIQPSRYEGKSIAVREAQLLGKPVVITRFPTSASQLREDYDGVIVPMDNEGCAAGIAALLRDPEKMNMLSENCLRGDYSNAVQAEKLMQLLG